MRYRLSQPVVNAVRWMGTAESEREMAEAFGDRANPTLIPQGRVIVYEPLIQTDFAYVQFGDWLVDMGPFGLLGMSDDDFRASFIVGW